MPGLAQGNNGVLQFGNGATASSLYSLSCSNGSANGFWSKHRDVVSYNQLQKVYINTYKEFICFFFKLYLFVQSRTTVDKSVVWMIRVNLD